MSPGEGPRDSGGDSSSAISGLDLDKVIHERSRLRILTFLASSASGEVGFTEVRDALGLTAGNLSVQLRTLEEAGYLRIEKRFVDNKSFTGLRLTPAGEAALTAYLAELEIIVASLKLGVAAQRGPAEAPADGE
jgi:DNA-binding MarR family transcriptional regulator